MSNPRDNYPLHYPENDKGGGRTKKKAFKRSPCGRPPQAPDGLTGSFDRAESGRHNRIRANVRWTEVTQDTSDVHIRIRHYKCELEYTANGDDWFLARRVTVSAKDDDDDGSKDHYKFKDIAKDLGYRYRVRAIAFDGCKSAWSDYFVIGNPGTDEPPAPSNVKIVDKDKHMRVTLKWSGQESTDDSDLFDDEINHFVAEISKQSGFGTIYDKNRGVKGNHTSFRIDDSDADETFYGRVRSVSADKDKSAWIPATLSGNSDPGANPDGVSVGQAMEKTDAPKAPTGLSLTFNNDDESRHNGRWRAKALWNEVVQDVNSKDVDIDKYAVDFQQSSNGTTWTNDPRREMVHAKDEDGNTTAYRIFHNINQNKFYRFRVRAISESNTRGVWSSWTGDSQSPGTVTVPTPTDVTIHHKSKPKDRVIMNWDAPARADDSDLPDEKIDYFQVVIKKNSSTAPTTLASGYKFDRMIRGTDKHFRVPKVDQDETFYGWVRAIDVEGNKSSWVAATTSGNSTVGTTASGIQTDDGVAIGVIRKHAGATIPQGYLRADGSSVSTTTYSDLFDEIGYTYGGSGGTFVLPDHRKRHGKGVGTGQSLGQNEGQSEGSRDETHGKHNRGTHKNHKKNHKHKHHHRRRRRHDPHSGGDTASGGGSAHQHGIPSGQNTGNASAGAASGGSGTPTDLTRSGHQHASGSWNTNTSGAHEHNVSTTQVQGTVAKSKGLSYYSSDGGGNAGHDDHDGEQVEPSGASSLYTDSLTGGSISSTAQSTADRSTSWTGGPTDTSGTAIELDDVDAASSVLGSGNAGHGDHPLPDDDDGVKGHRNHPFLRVHYNIKAY